MKQSCLPLLAKRHVSLIEVLVALMLTVFVLLTLLFFYQQAARTSQDIDTIKTQHFYLRYVENRLSAVLPRAINEKSKDGDFTFFSINDEGIGLSGSQSLIFTFDNDVSRDQRFSNHVIGRLFVDKKGHLILAYWPSPKRHNQGEEIPVKKEILLEHVASLSFDFFIPPGSNKNDTSASASSETPSPEPRGGWRKQLWLKDFKQLPAMVRLNITLENNPSEILTFIFPLVNTLSQVLYE